MDSQDFQSIFLPEKPIDHDAKMFILSAHEVGISVKLMNKFLQESNYASTITIVQDELKAVSLSWNKSNCSRASGMGRRYLTYIADKFQCNTLEQLAEIALNEVTTFYDFDNDAFVNYWHEFCAFKNQLVVQNENGKNIYNPANNDWVMHALTYFGYTFIPLSNYLSENNNRITPKDIIKIYKDELKRSNRKYFYPGALHPNQTSILIVKDFWKCSRHIGKEFHTIIEWTIIFLGRNFTEESIKDLAHIN